MKKNKSVRVKFEITSAKVHFFLASCLAFLFVFLLLTVVLMGITLLVFPYMEVQSGKNFNLICMFSFLGTAFLFKERVIFLTPTNK